MKINIKSLLFLVSFLSLGLIAEAQTNWQSICNARDWVTPPPCNITFTNTTSNGASVNFAPYYSYSTIEYLPSSLFDLTNNSTVTFSISTATTSLEGKAIGLTVTDNANHTSPLDSRAILQLSANGQPMNFSIDFKEFLPSSFILNSGFKVTFTLYDHRSASSSPANLNGSITISNINFGRGIPGTSGTVNPQTGWQLLTSEALINVNPTNVLIGNFSTIGYQHPLLSRYYQFVVNGRSNFIGNDNILGLWSSLAPASGFRHYLGISNSTFQGSNIEYSLINASEWNSATSTGNPKNLILQNFQNGGNIGIGYFVTPPTSKLSVNGTVQIGTVSTPSAGVRYNLFVEKGILTEGLRIALKTNSVNWADFVFDKSYKLKSLDDVEKFVMKNKHLPEIPSAEEVYKDGIDVAQMDAKLLMKIEELTLYLIQLKKENDKQQKEIEVLKKKLN